MAVTTIPAAANGNIQATTRALWGPSVVPQVIMKNPLYARLWLQRQIKWDGGTSYVQPVLKDLGAGTTQAYSANEPLTSQGTTHLDNPVFKRKLVQHPVTYGVQEELDNSGGKETAPIDLSKFLVTTANEATRRFMSYQMYGAYVTPAAGYDSTDAGKNFQSIRQALTHDLTYGTLSRATTATNKWWQGASIDETYADWDTAGNCDIVNFRKAMAACQTYSTASPGDYLCIVGTANFLKLQAYVAGNRVNTSEGQTMLAKYGFTTMEIDGVEVVHDPMLRDATITNSHKWFFLLNTKTWQLLLHPKRSFLFTGFTWQGDQVGGLDQWLARIMLAGNLVCWQPNANLHRSDFT